MKRYAVAAVLLLAFLSGCAGLDRQRCTDYGYTLGSPDFAYCMEARASRRSAALGAMSGALLRPQPPAVYQPPATMAAPQVTTCRRTWSGVECTTF